MEHTVAERCTKAPEGWFCTLPAEHEGPCPWRKGYPGSDDTEGYLWEVDVHMVGGHNFMMVPNTVRAWSLPEALRKAADVPLGDWFPSVDDEVSCLGWREEHGRFARLIFWLRGIGHCGKPGRKATR
jgi:hypothetical protein